MDTLQLPSRSAFLATSAHKACRCTPEGCRVSLSSSYSRVPTQLSTSFKVADRKQLRAGHWRSLAATAKLVTEEGGETEATLVTEEVGEAEAKLVIEEGGEIEAELTTEDDEEVEDVAPTNSGSDDAVAQSVALLKTAAKTRKVPASEIYAAFRVLAKAKVDPTDFPSFIGGTKSPGRTWLLVFTSSKEEGKGSEGGGKYFPVTAVQHFDAEARTIENGVYLGPLGELTFCGNYKWEKRTLSFIFHTLSLKVGPLGPFRIGIGSKDKEITKSDPFFIWYYADDQIVVGKGRAGGTAFWVRCARAKEFSN